MVTPHYVYFFFCYQITSSVKFVGEVFHILLLDYPFLFMEHLPKLLVYLAYKPDILAALAGVP